MNAVRGTFEEVVRRHGEMVLRVCRAVVGADLAEDAWSETFLSAMRAYPDLPVDTNVEAWLVTIAHRKGLDQLRARGRRPVPSERVPERAAADGETPGAELWSALAALPDKQRRAVAYHHLVGLPYKDVAEILGGTAAAARRAASDGLSALRRTYAADERRADIERRTP
jgi:RNA polymerase sigma factor (sigma-70 family)